MKVVGTRHADQSSIADQAGLARTAAIAHGASRFTKDIDFLVDDAPENVSRIKRGLSILADNAAAEVADTDVRDHIVVRVVDEVIVDLMGRAC